MSLADAKTILTDVLSKQYADSMLLVYTERDSLHTNTIVLQKEEIALLNKKFDNQVKIVDNLNKILENKDKEITDLNKIIKDQKREIRKQKILKIVGFTAAVILPITTIFLMSH